MLNKLSNTILLLSLITFTSCKTKIHNESGKADTISVKNYQSFKDTFKLTASVNLSDKPTDKYLTELLKPIRENFKKLNSIKSDNWSNIQIKKLDGTNESGEATYYYWNSNLSKIITKEYGETFQVLTEYYFLGKQLSFVFEKSYKYNRPIYQDTTAMKEMNDTETFEFDRSEINENRSYFDKRRLIYQLNNQDPGSSFTDTYLQEEQIRILKNLDRVIKNKK